jgi:carboxyl-terminal processing protease
MLRALIALCLLAAPLGERASAQGPGEEPNTLTAEERVFWLAKLWEEVDYNFAYFDQVPDLDWDQHFRDYIPRVIAATTDFEYYRLLQRFLARLKDGHTLVIYPWGMRQRQPIDLPWVELREVDRRAIVENVDTSLAALLPPGSEIVRVAGSGIPERLEAEVFPWMAYSTEHVKWREGVRGSLRHMWGLLAGPAGTAVEIEYSTPDGERAVLELIRDRSTRESAWVVAPNPEPLLEHRELEDGIAYVALNSFNDPRLIEEFDALMPALLRARGVVLDLRRNGGGKDDVAKQILDRLTDRVLLGPAWRTRRHVAAFRAWGVFADEDDWAEQYRPYVKGDVWHEAPPDTLRPGPGGKLSAPVAVLVGQETASSAENFLIYLDQEPRFTLVGQPTVGSSGQPLFINLPLNGLAWICTKRNTYPDGTTYIGHGVQPDVLVPVTVEDVRLGRDRTLEEAVAWLREQRATGG